MPIAAIVIVIALAVIVSLPYLASTNLVRDRISQQLSFWIGYRVQIDEAPEIQVFPSLKAILRAVSVYEWGRDDGRVLQAERVEADLSLFAAFRGEVDITGVTLVRPHFIFARNSSGGLRVPLPTAGQLYNAIKSGQTAEKANSGPIFSNSSPKIGSFKIIDGWVSAGSGKGDDTLTSIDGTVDWPSLTQSLSISGKAIWHGEAIQVNFSTSDPVSGLSLKDMPVSFSLKSAPLTASFDGKANFANGTFFDGKLAITTPSAQRALSWYGVDMPKGDIFGPLQISSSISGNPQRLKLENAEISFGQHKGTGVVDFRDENGTLMLGGTLAFNSLDILAMLNTFGEIPENGVSMNPEFDKILSRKLQLDLRLSATEAGAGPIALANVATNIQVTKDLTAIDIAGADALGGKVQAGLRFDRKADGDTGEVRILANEISGEKLCGALGIKRFSTNAPLTLSVIVRGPAENWRMLARGSHGTISLKFGAGTLAGFDIVAFTDKLKSPEFFALSETEKNKTDIKSADFKLTVANGIGRIEKAEIRTDQSELSFNGLIAPFDGSVALAGKLQMDNDEDTTPKSWSFFMGGTPSSPFVSPVFPLEFQHQ